MRRASVVAAGTAAVVMGSVTGLVSTGAQGRPHHPGDRSSTATSPHPLVPPGVTPPPPEGRSTPQPDDGLPRVAPTSPGPVPMPRSSPTAPTPVPMPSELETPATLPQELLRRP